MRDRTIVPATRMDCASFVIGRHYAARWPSVSFAWALMVNGVLEGVVTYGTPSSAPLRIGVAGDAYSKNVLELNRLCLKDNTRNDASWLVSHSMKALKAIGNFIVVSFADTSQGHIGTVYQACGFLYTGLSAKRTDWKIKGMEHLHGQTIADEFRGQNGRASAMRQKYGDDFYLEARSRKHRYIKVVGTAGFRAQAIKSIKYTIQQYPKGTAE